VGALFFLSFADTDGTAEDGCSYAIGFTDGTTSKSLSGDDRHNVATSVVGGETWDDPIALRDPADATDEVRTSFVSWITNGVRLNVTTAPANGVLLTCVFFAGTDSSADVGTWTFDNANAVDVTSVGFEADLVFTLCNGGGWPSDHTHGRETVGVVHNDRASGLAQRWASVSGRDSRATSVNRSYFSASEGGADFKYAVQYEMAFSAFDASGFTVTPSASAGTDVAAYLALRFGSGPAVDSWVGTHTTPTGTGNDGETGPGFTPQTVILFGTFAEAVDTLYADARGGVFMMSAFDADEAYAVSACVEVGVATMNTQCLSDNVAVELPDDDGSAGLTASFVSFDANGWTLNYSAVEAAAKLFIGVAIEEEAAAGVTVPVMYYHYAHH